jgi:hypothetical protein
VGAVRLPLAAAAGAALAAGLAAAHAATLARPEARDPLAVAGAATVVALVVAGAAAWPRVVGAAVVALAAGYATALGLRSGPDGLAPVEAALLLAAWELGHWACEVHAPAAADAGWLRDRLLQLAVGLAAAVAIGWVALAPGGAGRAGGLAVTGAGIAAAVGALALAARLARRA